MALKTTQNQLKREFREEIRQLKKAIQLQCAQCMGFFLDGYETCSDEACPLNRFYPRKGKAQSRAFKEQMVDVAKVYGNEREVLNEIISPTRYRDTETNKSLASREVE